MRSIFPENEDLIFIQAYCFSHGYSAAMRAGDCIEFLHRLTVIRVYDGRIALLIKHSILF